MQTPFQSKMELVGNVLAEFITHEIHHDWEMEEVYELNVDDYWQDLRPHVIRKLKEYWEEGITIHTHEGADS